MSSLFEDLKQGLEEANEYEKGKGKARVKTYSNTPVKEYLGKELKSNDEEVKDIFQHRRDSNRGTN